MWFVATAWQTWGVLRGRPHLLRVRCASSRCLLCLIDVLLELREERPLPLLLPSGLVARLEESLATRALSG